MSGRRSPSEPDPTCVRLTIDISVPIDLSARLDLMLRGAIQRARKQYHKQNDGDALEKILQIFHDVARRESS